MEEVQSNDDEVLPLKASRANDLLRTGSQQSDSSGFAEDPSSDSNNFLKLQESSDSCDSETTVTSHASHDVATPLALDQPAFDRLVGKEEEEEKPGSHTEADGRCSPRGAEEHDGSSEQVVEQLPENGLTSAQEDGNQNQNQEQTETRDWAGEEPESETSPNQTASQPELEQNQNQSSADPDPQQGESGQAVSSRAECVVSDGAGPEDTLSPSLMVHSALERAKQHQLTRASQRADLQPRETLHSRGRGRGRVPFQRSSSLPCSLLSPSKVVSSVRIQFGRGAASCTRPRYSYKYCQEGGEEVEEVEEVEEDEEQQDEQEGQTKCLSTLIINPASSHTNNQSPRPHTDAPAPLRPKAIPPYLMRSSYSLQSPSPPPDWPERSLGGCTHSWSTQSIPDLFSNQPNASWNQSRPVLSYSGTPQPTNPSPVPPQYLNPIAGSNPNPSSPNPYPLNPYASLPNLHYPNASLPHHGSLTSLHQPTAPTIPQHGSFSNLHQPATPTMPQHTSLSNLHHPGAPILHHQGYPHPPPPHSPYLHQSPYHLTHPGSPYQSPYHGYHGYLHHHPAFPYPLAHSPIQRPASAPGHSLHSLLPGGAPAAAPGSAHAPSSTEMQLRRVLHDIRGTVQSLGQSSADSPDMFNDHRAAPPSLQSVAELQQKRRSLNLFRSHMMDLELSIMQQQAQVYTHMSPADRLEAEQLQTLRSAVREELQELEQQLDKVMDLTQHTRRLTGLHRGSSVDSLSAASALRAMEPVSDLLREQLLLQSELGYEGHAPSTGPSSRCSSPIRRGGEHQVGVYRASINITPAPPPRLNTHTEEEEGEEGQGRGEEPTERGGGGGGGGGGGQVENLQQLIREIRESVAQEVRQEIFSELLAAASPQRSHLATRQHPL
uniref:ITPR interacting domain containing 2 n=2 Tax=Myripristis murdjan TaxID=586833 RepID=A0A667XA28_9TELE